MWIFPWVIGTMFYHFHASHWKRAFGWLLAVLMIPSLVLAWIFAHALENVFYAPHTTLLVISIIVMILQAVHWMLTWRDYRSRNIVHRIRTVAIYAYIMSSLLGFLGIGSLVKEYIYKYRERKIAAEKIEHTLEILELAGYEPYPGALYPYGDIPVTGQVDNPDSPDPAGSITLQFESKDDTSDVIKFFDSAARSHDNWAIRGRTRVDERPALVVVGENHTSMEIIEWRDGYWIVIVSYGFEGGLDDLTKLNYIFEVPPELASPRRGGLTYK